MEKVSSLINIEFDSKPVYRDYDKSKAISR